MVVAVDDVLSFPHDDRDSWHVDVVELSVDVAWFYEGEVAMFLRIIVMFRKLTIGDELLQ
jgi:hypothetical protein